MLTKSFNKEELFESIYNESNLKRLNECGGWTAADERNWRKNQKRAKKEDEIIEDWFEKNISKDDPDYEWLEKALHYYRPNYYYSEKDPSRVMAGEKLRKLAAILKKRDADEKRKELLKGNRQLYMASHGITPEMEHNKKIAQSYESKARSLMKDAEEAQKTAESFWVKAGGKELWANFRVPRPNKNGEYSDA